MDLNTAGVFGPELCGPIVYDVYNLFGGLREPTTLVTKGPGDTLVLQPTLEDNVGTYDMLLCGKLEFYDREQCVQFRVKVIACQSQIIAPAAGAIPDQFNMWYSDPISFDISSVYSGYTQEPNCNYNFLFNVQYEKYP